MIVVVAVVLVTLAVACVAMAVRARRVTTDQVAAMPTVELPAGAWPVEVAEGESGPYLRGATVASMLSGRR